MQYTLFSITLLLVAICNAQPFPPPPPAKTCVYTQKCKRTEDQKWNPCPDPTQIHNSEIMSFAPKNIQDQDNYSQKTMSDLYNNCPFLGDWDQMQNLNSPTCCSPDQIAIQSHGFAQLDEVFSNDNSICGVNMKKMWCNYACSQNQNQFVKGIGYTEGLVNGQKTNLTEIEFYVDENMACTLFQSCKGVSLIAQASIQSSISFLDFLGVNGQNQTLSIITFILQSSNKEDPMTVDNVSEKCKLRGQPIEVKTTRLNITKLDEESDIDTEEIVPEIKEDDDMTALNSKVYDCAYKIPKNGTLEKYPSLKQPICQYCSSACKAPTVDSSVGFFDGFNSAVHLIFIACMVFTGFWQAYQIFYRKKIIDAEWDKIQQNDGRLISVSDAAGLDNTQDQTQNNSSPEEVVKQE